MFIEQPLSILDLPQNIHLIQLKYYYKEYKKQYFNYLSIPFPINLTDAVDKRCAEYLAGRYAATKALFMLTQQQLPVPANPDRSPCWPPGIIGSISHTDHHAVAMVAYDTQHAFLGIDIENWIDTAIANDIAKDILVNNEYTNLGQTGLAFNREITLIFSAKECLYKALYPSVKHFFGFDYASVKAINIATGTGIITLEQSLSAQWTAGCTFHIKFLITADHVLCLLWPT